jgi:hypothetical protein
MAFGNLASLSNIGSLTGGSKVQSIVENEAEAYWLASQKSGDYLVDLTGNGHDARFGSVGAARVINKGRAKYLKLNGVVANFASSPDSAALSITGDLDARADVAMNDWTPSAVNMIIGKYNNVNGGRAWAFDLLTTGEFRVVLSSDGTAVVTKQSTVAPTVVDGARLQVRVTVDVDNGASGYDVKFYTKTTGALSDNTGWAQLGTTVTTATATSIADTAALQTIGAFNDTGGGSPAQGRFYRTIVKNGIDGTTVFDADFTNLADGTTSFTESSSNAATVTINSASGADSNDPTYLEYTGTKYVYQPGIAGNYTSTPDDVSLQITGDIELVFDGALNDWSPAAACGLVSRYTGTAATSSYLIYLNTTGTISFYMSPDGINIGLSTQTPPAIADGQRRAIKITRRQSDGRVQFFSASTAAGPWTQFGVNQFLYAGLPINAGNQSLQIGVYNGGASGPMIGQIYAAQVRNGIDGTLVANFDATTATSPYATTTDSTGKIWTFNRSATGKKLAIVDRTMLLLGTDDYLEVQDQAGLNIGASDSFTLVSTLRHYGLVGATALVAKDTALSGTLGYHLRTNASSKYVWNTHDGTNENETGNTTDYTAGVVQALAGVRDVPSDLVISYLDGGVLESETDVTTATLSNTNVLRVGATSGSAASFGHFEFIGMAIFRKALTPAQLTQVKTELGG